MFNFFKSKPQLTQSNHFEHGFTQNGQSVFQVKLGVLSRAPKSGFEEAVRAAQAIDQNRGSSQVSLCLSGGIDSEAMLQAFLAAEVAFKIYFLRFKDGLNDHDIKTNMEICDRNGLKYTVLELDVIQFLESGRHLEYGRKYRCQSPQIAVHFWMCDQIEGLPVFGGNPFVQTEIDGHPFFIGLPGDLHCTYFRYFEFHNRAGVPWFFIYSPELCASFLKLPTPQRLRQQRINPSEYSYLMKCNTYQEAGFKVQPRRDKYTGFELLREHYDKLHGTSNGVSFDRLFRLPLEQMNPFPQRYLQLVPRDYLEHV